MRVKGYTTIEALARAVKHGFVQMGEIPAGMRKKVEWAMEEEAEVPEESEEEPEPITPFEEIDQMNGAELKKLAKELALKGYSQMKVNDLRDALKERLSG